MPVLLIALYVLFGILNIVNAVFFWDPLRKLTKCCLMPALAAYYLAAAGSAFQLTVVIALAFSWIGDIVLINKDKPLFLRLGLGAFLLGHVFYIISILKMVPAFNYFLLALSAAAALVLAVRIHFVIKPPKQMVVPVIFYEIAIFTMSLCALQLMLFRKDAAGIAVFAGSLVFIFSDSLMAYLLFHGKPKYYNVITMLPYIAAQLCIIAGFAAL
jgi:uncharacterized membrane protein YhhN